MRILDLVLKHKWYDMIASGVKKEEYREIKEFYIRRLEDFSKLSIHNDAFQHYDAVRFHRGYTSNTMVVECKDIRTGIGDPAWGAPSYPVYIISLGEILYTESKKHD